MAKVYLLLFLFSVGLLYQYRTQGAELLESGLFRFDCYHYKQPGCNEEFIDAYPQYAWSYLNVSKATTFFYLSTNKNKDHPELLHKCGGHLPPNTKFNPKCKTIVMIPGFISGICNYAIFRELKNQFLKAGCFNILMVDWMWGNIVDLNNARNNFPILATHIAIVINNIRAKYRNLGPCDFELIGHSYGAHIAGMVGQRTPLCKITGIEPSGILHTENTPLDDRLDPSDATCVQAIHTNGGQCFPKFFGVNFTTGTIDFWVNGGLKNPSCAVVTLEAFLKEDFIYGLLSLFPAACNHFQALQFYKSSIDTRGCQFTGVKCDNIKDAKAGKCPNSCGQNGENCKTMGAYGCDCILENNPKPGPLGHYYVETDFLCPYCDNSWLDLNGYSCNLAQKG